MMSTEATHHIEYTAVLFAVAAHAEWLLIPSSLGLQQKLPCWGIRHYQILKSMDGISYQP